MSKSPTSDLPKIAPDPAEKRATRLKLLALAVVALGLLSLGFLPGVRELFKPEKIEQVVASLGIWGPGVIFALGVFTPLLFLPRWPIAVVSGLLYGVVWGTVLANTSSVLGALLHYAAARSTLGGPVHRWIERKRGSAHVPWPASKSFTAIFFLRAFPLSSFVATNILAGSLKIPWRIYLMASFLGMLPTTLMYTSCGKAVKNPGAGIYAVALASLVFLVAGTLWMQRRKRAAAASQK